MEDDLLVSALRAHVQPRAEDCRPAGLHRAEHLPLRLAQPVLFLERITVRAGYLADGGPRRRSPGLGGALLG
jgi:hypothetical protein